MWVNGESRFSGACLGLALGLFCTAAAAGDAAAARQAAESAVCQSARPFYWEIGDRSSVLASGSVGDDAPQRSTDMSIASASKWLYAAYVLQKRDGEPTAQDVQALTMRSGHVDFSDMNCVRLLSSRRESETVDDCLHRRNNDKLEQDAVGRFHYGGGHFQWHADTVMHLGEMNDAALATEVDGALGGGLGLDYVIPQLAGGGRISAAGYALFLQRILSHQLKMADWLGKDATCTLPGVCATADESPVPVNWQYSLGHWVETGAEASDGSFSSPGAFGFYPWIDADRHYYGILARQKRGKGQGQVSVPCGVAIRYAWLHGNMPEHAVSGS